MLLQNWDIVAICVLLIRLVVLHVSLTDAEIVFNFHHDLFSLCTGHH